MKMLAEQLGTTENSKQSLHCALSVAMNLTHHSDNGCQQVGTSPHSTTQIDSPFKITYKPGGSGA